MIRAGSVFSGIGLLDYGLHLAGIEHAWLCEWDEWRRGILAKRWPGVRVLDDVRHVGHGCEPVDLLVGGFPCKGASSAGKQEGFGHPETVLWREQRRAVRELRPRYVLVENVANILSLHRGEVWGEVLGDLAALGYGVVWDCIPAAAVGAPHLRDRVFAVAAHPTWDAEGGPEASTRPDRERARPRDHAASTDADGTHEQRHAGLRRLTDGRADARGGREAPADVDEPRADAHAATGRPWPPARERALGVEWGEYEPAIKRWRRIHGVEPEPLVRRVDDRDAARVERSRLSALGDGVQVQVGRIAGEYIVGLERARRGGLDG